MAKNLKMKLICVAVVILLSGNITVFSQSCNDIKPDAIDSNAAYILDENFSSTYIKKDGKFRVSGWEVKTAGGDAASMNPLMLVDSSTVLPVVLEKSLEYQDKGTITFETKLSMKSAMDGTKIELLKCQDTAFCIYFQDNKFYYKGQSSDLLLKGDYALQDYIYIRADLNLDTHTTNVYVDHSLILKDTNFCNDTLGINKIIVSTGVQSVGSMEIATIRLFKNFYINEQFNSQKFGVLPYGYVGSGDNTKSSSIEHLGGWSGTDGYALYLRDENPVSNCGVKKSISDTTDEITLEYLMKFDGKDSGSGIRLYDENAIVGQFLTKNGDFVWLDNSGVSTNVYKGFYEDMWYKVTLEINQATGNVDILLNSRSIGKNLKIASKKIKQLEFITSIPASRGIWIDNLTLTPKTTYAADYVPEPVIPKKIDDRLIGIQSCSLWEEGEGHGWNFIDSVRDREPIIGYYDEGSPEVADWEIKWLAEHGVDFQMYCWFGNPQGSVNKPVKTPSLDGGLHDGYKNAKYSDKLKFSIMFENQASHVASSEDFRKNNVRYWVEHYFKDPRYLVVDNKPVVAIYSIERLAAEVGGYDNAGADIEYIKQLCRDEGFDGAYVLCTTSSTSSKEINNWAKYGIDGVFSYNWGTSSGYDDMERYYLKNQVAASPKMTIPNIAVGWNAIPWGGEPGQIMEPEKFGDLITYTREYLLPKTSPDSLARKMLFMANWNEFGEGTFLYPTKKDGFSYLDSVRQALVGKDGHSDVSPTENQIRRLNRMYPDDVYVPLNTFVKPEPSNVEVKKWDFETSVQGWAPTRDTNNFRNENGMLSMDVVGRDSGVAIDNLGLDIGTVNYIKFTFINNTPSSTGRIYFTTEEDTTPNEAKGIRFYNLPNSKAEQTIYVYTGYNKNWKGKLSTLRIDAVEDALGTMSIGEVTLLKDIKQEKATIKINGETVRFSATPIEKDGTILVDYESLCDALSAKNEFSYDTSSINILLGDTLMKVNANSNIVTVDGKEKKLNTVPITTGDTIMLPLRSICEALGCEVTWTQDTRTVDINTNPNQPEVPKSLASWEFDLNGNKGGWYGNEQMYLSNPVKGTMRGGIINSSDPFMEMGKDINVPCADIKEMKIRMKTPPQMSTMKIYYSTVESPSMSEERTFSFAVDPEATDFVEYTIPASNIGWNGTLKRLRWDFENNASGDFEIDYIRLQ